MFLCFTNYNLLIVCQQQCIKGKLYKYFTSAPTFFQSKCDIMNVVNYNLFLRYSVYCKFDDSASLDLLLIMLMIDLLLTMLIIDYCLFFCVLPVAVTGSPNLLCCILRYFIDFAFCCCAI